MREHPINERLLAGELKNGNAAAFRTLYENYSPRLQGFAAGFGLNRDEADEIVQETFVRLWKHREAIDPSLSFSTYLMTIAKHLIYNHLKRATHRDVYMNEMSRQLTAQQGAAAPDDREMRQEVMRAITILPEKCRLVFRKSRLEGLSNQEISAELNISKSTVENQLNKALKLIRRFLNNRGYNIPMLMLLWFNE